MELNQALCLEVRYRMRHTITLGDKKRRMDRAEVRGRMFRDDKGSEREEMFKMATHHKEKNV